jgi:uncharacterized cupredoxin-like copper-binding protein
MKKLNVTYLLCASLFAAGVHAHGDAPHAAKKNAKISSERHAWGMQGDPRMARRTVHFEMRDTMRFVPSFVSVKRGETVRIVIKNSGALMHEWVLGTRTELEKHAELMKKFPEMEHDEPYMAHVKPNAKGEIVWTFTQPGEFMFACLLPGHFEAGMKGSILVEPQPKGHLK